MKKEPTMELSHQAVENAIFNGLKQKYEEGLIDLPEYVETLSNELTKLYNTHKEGNLISDSEYEEKIKNLKDYIQALQD